jgi:hypothetical protein
MRLGEDLKDADYSRHGALLAGINYDYGNNKLKLALMLLLRYSFSLNVLYLVSCATPHTASI